MLKSNAGTEVLHEELNHRILAASAHANPAAWGLLNAPQPQPGATERSVRSSATLLRTVAAVAGERDALPAARTLVPWVQGFVTMELAGAFRLGGDVEQAWRFGLDHLLIAISLPDPLRLS